MCIINILYRNGIEKVYKGEWNEKEIETIMNNISSEKGYMYLEGKEEIYLINVKDIVSVEIRK